MDTILLHPSYFPSIEQMAAVVQSDKVIWEVMDNYQKQTYRNRTYIAHSNGKLLLNVPIKHDRNGKRQKTREVIAENDFPWQEQHWKSLQNAYRTSPFFEFYEDELEPLFTEKVENLLQHNFKIFHLLSGLIGYSPEEEHTVVYKDTPKVADFRFLINAKRKPTFILEPYTQVLQANHGFLPYLSILDLLFNEGPHSLSYLRRQPVLSQLI